MEPNSERTLDVADSLPSSSKSKSGGVLHGVAARDDSLDPVRFGGSHGVGGLPLRNHAALAPSLGARGRPPPSSSSSDLGEEGMTTLGTATHTYHHTKPTRTVPGAQSAGGERHVQFSASAGGQYRLYASFTRELEKWKKNDPAAAADRRISPTNRRTNMRAVPTVPLRVDSADPATTNTQNNDRAPTPLAPTPPPPAAPSSPFAQHLGRAAFEYMAGGIPNSSISYEMREVPSLPMGLSSDGGMTTTTAAPNNNDGDFEGEAGASKKRRRGGASPPSAAAASAAPAEHITIDGDMPPSTRLRSTAKLDTDVIARADAVASTLRKPWRFQEPWWALPNPPTGCHLSLIGADGPRRRVEPTIANNQAGGKLPPSCGGGAACMVEFGRGSHRDQIAFVTSLRPEICLRSLRSLGVTATTSSNAEADADPDVNVYAMNYMPTCVAWDHDGALYVGSGSGGVHHVDANNGRVVTSIGARAGGIGDRVWSVSVGSHSSAVNGKVVVYTDHSGLLRMYGSDGASRITTLYPAASSTVSGTPSGGAPLRDVDIHRTLPLIACGSADGNAYIFDVRMTSRGPLFVLPAAARAREHRLNTGVLATRWSGPSQHRLVTATDDGSLLSWHLGAESATLENSLAAPPFSAASLPVEPTRLQPQRTFCVWKRGGGARSPFAALSCRADGLCATGTFGGNMGGVVGIFYPAWDAPVATSAVDVKGIPRNARSLQDLNDAEEAYKKQPHSRSDTSISSMMLRRSGLAETSPSFASVSWREMSPGEPEDDFPTCVASTLEGSLAALRLEKEGAEDNNGEDVVVD